MCDGESSQQIDWEEGWVINREGYFADEAHTLARLHAPQLFAKSGVKGNQTSH
jgi:hypothetical protein